MSWIDLTDMLTLAGKSIPVGRVLMFNKKGKETHIEIVRKHKGKIWGKEIYLYKPDEVDIKDK